MDNIFWSTCPTEMLWYSNLKYNQPGVHFCNYYKYSGPPYTFIASIWKLLFVLAFLSFDMQEGASLKKDFKPHWKKVIFLSQIVGWKPIVHCHNTVPTMSQHCHNMDLMAYSRMPQISWHICFMAYSKMPWILWHIQRCYRSSAMDLVAYSFHWK